MTDIEQLNRAICWYDTHARERAEAYCSVDAADTNAWWADLLPVRSCHVVDVGAGSGRDAAWLAGMGHQVTAVEPSQGMRHEAHARRDSPGILWVDDALPSLEILQRCGVVADVVLVSAVWMHMPPSIRPAAMASLSGLLRPGGLLVMTVRQGPVAPERMMHEAAADEVVALADASGLSLVRDRLSGDLMGRGGVVWNCLAFRVPDII